MIKCKVTKKIMQEPGTVMGFSIGQVIMLIVGCAATIVAFAVAGAENQH